MNRLTEMLKAAAAMAPARIPALRAAAAWAAGWIPDALIASGAGAVAYGAWLVYPPAGHIVGGVLAMAGGVLLARGAK